jgi:hypothetical protein
MMGEQVEGLRLKTEGKNTLEQPLIIPISRKKYKLVEQYEYVWMEDKEKYKLVIPKGFVCDGASVPRLIWTLSGLRPDGLIRAAALIHDFIYQKAGKAPAGNNFFIYTGFCSISISMCFGRHEADKLFLRLMKEAGMTWYRRTVAYRAVRCFGWLAWKKSSKLKAEG